jgi:hypothetical protein
MEDVPGTRLVLGAPGDRRRIGFDREHGVSLVERWPRARRRIAIADIDRVRVTVGRDFALTLAIRYRTRRSMSELSRTFAVRALDLDAEALDLAFRIARIARLGGYLVRRESKDHRVIELVAQAPTDSSPYRVRFPALHSIDELAGGAVLETPAIVAPASYRDERASFTEPETPVKEVRTGETIIGLHVAAWDPARVELTSPRTITTSRAVWDALRGTGATIGMLVLAAFLIVSFEGCRQFIGEGLDESGFYGIEDYLAFAVVVSGMIGLFVAAVATPFSAIGIAIEVRRKLRSDLRYRASRRITFDGELVVLETTTRRREVRLRDIEGVVLRRHQWLTSEVNTWSELELMLVGDDELVLVTPPGPKLEQKELERVAIGLARVLDVPWRVE